jgi:predicted transcriptional regulator
MFKQRESIAAHIETGFAQAERGELIEGDAAIEMLRRRRSERLKPRG